MNLGDSSLEQIFGAVIKGIAIVVTFVLIAWIWSKVPDSGAVRVSLISGAVHVIDGTKATADSIRSAR